MKKLSKLLLGGFAALTLATPTLATPSLTQKPKEQFCNQILKSDFDIFCKDTLKWILFRTCKMDEYDNLKSFNFSLSSLPRDITSNEFQCITREVQRLTNNKYQFILYSPMLDEKGFNIKYREGEKTYKLERTKNLK